MKGGRPRGSGGAGDVRASPRDDTTTDGDGRPKRKNAVASYRPRGATRSGAGGGWAGRGACPRVAADKQAGGGWLDAARARGRRQISRRAGRAQGGAVERGENDRKAVENGLCSPPTARPGACPARLPATAHGHISATSSHPPPACLPPPSGTSAPHPAQRTPCTKCSPGGYSWRSRKKMCGECRNRSPRSGGRSGEIGAPRRKWSVATGATPPLPGGQK